MLNEEDADQELSELDGEGRPEVGVDVSGTVCEVYGRLNQPSAIRYQQKKEYREGQNAFWIMMRLEENDMGRHLKVARNAGPFRPFRQRRLEVILAH